MNRESKIAERVAAYYSRRNRNPPSQMPPNWDKWDIQQVKQDWERILGQILPGVMTSSTKYVQLSPDRNGARGWKAETTLFDGSLVVGVKTPDFDGSMWSGRWDTVTADGIEFGMRMGPSEVARHFREKYLTLLQRYKYEIDGYDVTASFSDDARYEFAQDARQRRAIELYDQMDPATKKEAYDYYVKATAGWRREYPSLKFQAPPFSSFTGG